MLPEHETLLPTDQPRIDRRALKTPMRRLLSSTAVKMRQLCKLGLLGGASIPKSNQCDAKTQDNK